MYDKVSEYMNRDIWINRYVYATCTFYEQTFNNMDLIGTIFRDFLKAYECCPRDLIIAKFKDCSISKEGLKILLDIVCSTK